MVIKQLKSSHFKSFNNLNIELEQFNVLIGPNAAGKSNFLHLFQFLRDIVNHGLANAISLQGGIGFIRNINLQKDECDLNLEISLIPDKFFKFKQELNGKTIQIEIDEICFDFELQLNEFNYTIKKDKLTQNFKCWDLSEEMKIRKGGGSFTVVKDGNNFDFDMEMDSNVPITEDNLKNLLIIGYDNFLEERRFLSERKMSKRLLLETPLYFLPHIENIKADFGDIGIYDIDPQSLKTASVVVAKADLEENGANLALVLRNILADEEQRLMFFNLVQDILPFIDDLNVDKLHDKFLQINLKEVYSKAEYVPAYLMSDGTIFLISVIVALYFESNPIAIFEEVGRRLHPHLISKLIDMMKDASSQKQIIVSTHNPEIVKYAGIENIIFISRDSDGFSVMNRPNESEEIRTFLENEIGLEDLFIKNLLK